MSSHFTIAPKVRVAQQLIGARGKSERDAASAFPDIESLVMEEGEHQYQYENMYKYCTVELHPRFGDKLAQVCLEIGIFPALLQG